jgi:cob(I)alamin adenosyltransferase
LQARGPPDRHGRVKIYTKTGDGGETGLFGGPRVRKSDHRVDAYGEVDELNAAIGVVLAGGVDPAMSTMLQAIQRDLFAVGGRLADPSRRVAERVEKMNVGAAEAERLEQWIDQLESDLPPLRRFILPGGSSAGAALHLARTICRRAERRIVLLGVDEVPAGLLAYVNRLSDFLFVAARAVNRRAGAPELEW